MPTYTLAPYEARQYFDGNGDPLAGGFVYTWVTGSATPLQTFSNSTGTLNTNPIELDSEGRCRIYLLPQAYKFTLTDADGVPVGLTMDPVTAVDAGASGLGEIFTFGSNAAAAITQTSYASGATFDKLQPGSAVFQADSANLSGTYKIQITGLMTTSGTLTVAIVDLSSGAPDTPLAEATLTSLTGAVATSGAITFGASGVDRNYGIKPKVSANTGFLIGASLIRTA